MVTAEAIDVAALHNRMGKVNSQPISVSSYTNKRFTVNYRVPLDELRRIMPDAVEVEEIRDTGFGMISMCACDFKVVKLGALPVIPIRNNDMLCRVSAKVRKGEQTYRAYYTLHSESSSRFLGLTGGHFSHFRKKRSDFRREDNDQCYSLECLSVDPLYRGSFKGMMGSIFKDKPTTTIFVDVQEATDFVFKLDGSCGYDFGRDMLSFQRIIYPAWDISFCHDSTFRFPLLDHLFSTYDLHAALDCVLYMHDVPQTWGSAWLYRNTSVPGR